MNALDWFASLAPASRAELARSADARECELMVQLSGFVDWRQLSADSSDTMRSEKEDS